MVEQMVQKINEEIEGIKRLYEVTNQHDALGNAKIHGMIEMLQMVTGKQYYYDKNGLHERV